MQIVTLDKEVFPIRSIHHVVELFQKHLQPGVEPNLPLLSIVVGYIENNLTAIIGGKSGSNDKESSVHLNKLVKVGFPELTYDEANNLYNKFVSLIKSSFDLKSLPNGYATREVIKKVSDVIWNSLARSYYKDKAHLQSIYSYLNGKKLDCFGVSFAVVAGCQVLGYSDVHLSLSEDHAWVVFGNQGLDTAEVTWHGKGNEDKRGQPIGFGTLSKSWLYVAGYPVVCSRQMEVAALVSSINPSLTLTTDVYEIALMQQHLLWVLYDLGHLNVYPMALGNLGELEEASKYTDGKTRPSCSDLYFESIQSARKNYFNRHVYPYTFQGAYFFRNKMYKEAFGSWADASDVIRTYNYSRDDEEIYKEFAEIANELIPQIIKTESSGHSARSILKDPICFAHLLRFYDGICKWEEESQTPILHIGWAKPLVTTISKFDAAVRAQVDIECCEETDVPEDSDVTNVPMHDRIIKLEDTITVQDSSNSDDNKNSGKTEQPTDVKLDENFINVVKPNKSENSGCENNSKIIFYSHKMKGLKNLLLSEKINTRAISLLLTAQSQVFVNKKIRPNELQDQQPVHCSTRPKRSRRE